MQVRYPFCGGTHSHGWPCEVLDADLESRQSDRDGGSYYVGNPRELTVDGIPVKQPPPLPL